MFPYILTISSAQKLKVINVRKEINVTHADAKLNNDPICKGLKWIRGDNSVWLGDSTGNVAVYKIDYC